MINGKAFIQQTFAETLLCRPLGCQGVLEDLDLLLIYQLLLDKPLLILGLVFIEATLYGIITLVSITLTLHNDPLQ